MLSERDQQNVRGDYLEALHLDGLGISGSGSSSAAAATCVWIVMFSGPRLPPERQSGEQSPARLRNVGQTID